MKLFKSMFSFKRFHTSFVDAMVSRNAGQSMVGPLMRVFPAMQGNVSASFIENLKVFLKDLSKIRKHQGSTGLVKFLKACSVLTQQALCEYNVRDFSPRVSRTNRGLPRVIPAQWRRLLRQENQPFTRMVLTIFSIFRNIDLPEKTIDPDKVTKTITAPFSGNKLMIQEVISRIPRFVALFGQTPPRMRRALLANKFRFITLPKSSPQAGKGLASTHPVTLLKSAQSLSKFQVFAIEVLARLSVNITDDTMTKPLISTLIAKCREDTVWRVFKKLPEVIFKIKDEDVVFKSGLRNRTRSLSLKIEPAGKIRVFALVDPWTQMVMRPFHLGLFSILRKHPKIDGTFDQLRPLNRAFRFKSLYSMDLSAATDRLPIAIQTPLLKEFFGLSDLEAQAWEFLLIGEKYFLRANQGDSGKFYAYSVGQPMGALSSWAMLACTHHLIVQTAAWRVGFPLDRLFRDYAILGDDIVIFNKRVAMSYKRIIAGLGVECNPAKSIYSPKGVGLEFAKKTFVRGKEVSPIPLSEFRASTTSPVALLEFGRRYNLTFPQLLRVAGFGYRVLGNTAKPFHKQTNFKVKTLMMVSLFQRDHFSTLFRKSFGSPGYGLLATVTESFVERLNIKLFVSLMKDLKVMLSSDSAWAQSIVPVEWNQEVVKSCFHELYSVIVRPYRFKYISQIKIILDRFDVRVPEFQFFETSKTLENYFTKWSSHIFKFSLPDKLEGENLFNFHLRRLKMLLDTEKELSAFSLDTFEQLRDIPRTIRGIPKVTVMIQGWEKLFLRFISKEQISLPAPNSDKLESLTVRESSFFPWRALRGVFLTSRHTTSRVSRIGSPNFRLLTLPIASGSFGLRTLLWLWISEGILSLICMFCTYPIYLFGILLYQWMIGEGTLLSLFPLVFGDLIPNLTLDEIKNFILGFFDNRTSISYVNFWIWSSWITIQILCTSWYHTEVVSIITEALSSGIPVWQVIPGAILGIFYKFGLYPIYNIAIGGSATIISTLLIKIGTPVGMLSSFTIDNVWFSFIKELSTVVYHFIVENYTYICYGKEFSVTSYEEFPLLNDKPLPPDPYTDPWGDQSSLDRYFPELGETLGSSSELQEPYISIVEVTETPTSWISRLGLMIIHHPYIYGSLWIGVSVGIKLACASAPMEVGTFLTLSSF
jgi:hypothetical protein